MSVTVERVRRQLGAAGLALTLCCAPLLVLGQAASRPGSPPGTVDLSRWLPRIQQAASTRTYQGTLMFSAGGVVSSSKVVHVCDGRQRFERIEVLDGRSRLQYRHNEQLVTLWPAARVAVLEDDDTTTEFPSLPRVPAARLQEHYELKPLGADRVAGHDADVLLLKPRDEHRFAQRLWVERETGLLLRGDVLGRQGEVLESSAFIDLRIGGRVPHEPIATAMKRLDGYRVVKSGSVRADLEGEGWRLARSVPGFQLVACSKRALDAAEPAAQPSVPVLQTVFSDGLSQVSVFVEPYDAQRHRQPMRTSLGATHTLASRRGDWWVTVVGEVPLPTAQQFETLLERKPTR